MDILENMRKMLEAGEISKEDIERAFPKLKESDDEMIRKEIISIVKEYGRICEKEGDPCCTINDCLAYLEKQKDKVVKFDHDREQKPAGWSEEDEKMRKSIINDLENAETDDEDVQKELNEMVAWLKSLRPQPHWKPSKKQIDALNSIILTGSFSYVGQTQDLISLKDELKKLL